jgi:hypothetical protein
MGSVKGRLLAAPLVIACVGFLGSAATAHAQTGGLSIKPAILENRAKVGRVGSVTLHNTTKETLRVTVRVRPWMQQLDGKVFTNPKATLTRYVRPTRSSFRIAPGAQVPITLQMRRRTRSGSLYGNLNIFGKPVNTRGRKGIIPQYQLVSSVRLHPRRKSLRLRTGAAQIRRGQIILPVRNLGNTIDAIGGNFRITGPSGRTGNMRAIATIPGKLVGLNLGATRGMKKGRYTVNATLTQAGRRFTTRTSFTIR